MTRVTCRLTAKDRDQLRNPTLGNRVRATLLHCTECNKLDMITSTEQLSRQCVKTIVDVSNPYAATLSNSDSPSP